MSIDVGTALVRRWQGRFGLGAFRIQVRPIDMDNPDAWAHSFYEITEEWAVIELPSDEFFPPATLELLVLHELAHGLLALAAEEGVLVEQTCNRLARLATGDYATPLMNEQREAKVGAAWYGVEGEERQSASTLDGPRGGSAIDKRKWLAVVADALPEGEREVISGLYYEGLSMRDVAERLGVDVHTVFRRKATALTRLRNYYDGLDATSFETARKLVELHMPEGGAEHEIVWETHHRCGPANSMAREMGDSVDALAFGVGVVGYNMPLNTVFAVTALGPCLACGVQPTCQFVWRKGHVGHSGTIWVPGA